MYSVSTDTHFVHKAWADTTETIGKIKYFMLGDANGEITNNFQNMRPGAGLADRATFLVDPEGVIQYIETTAEGIGRDAGELMRKVKAAQYVAAHPGAVSYTHLDVYKRQGRGDDGAGHGAPSRPKAPGFLRYPPPRRAPATLGPMSTRAAAPLVLDLSSDVVELTAAICDAESVSGAEGPLADAVEAALRPLDHLSVRRLGNVVIARTELGRAERVVLAGHLDTVPLTDPPNLPTRRLPGGCAGGELWGRGTVDMKGGVAVQLRLAATLPAPNRDVTYVFYDCEEVDAVRNGLAHVAASHPELLAADFAVLLEPTKAEVEGGCKGTLLSLIHI